MGGRNPRILTLQDLLDKFKEEARKRPDLQHDQMFIQGVEDDSRGADITWWFEGDAR